MQRIIAVVLLLTVIAVYVEADGLQDLLNPMKGINHRDIIWRLQKEVPAESKDEKRLQILLEQLRNHLTPTSVPQVLRLKSKKHRTAESQYESDEALKPSPDVESLKRLFSSRTQSGSSRFGSKNCFMSAIQCSFHYFSAHRK